MFQRQRNRYFNDDRTDISTTIGQVFQCHYDRYFNDIVTATVTGGQCVLSSQHIDIMHVTVHSPRGESSSATERRTTGATDAAIHSVRRRKSTTGVSRTIRRMVGQVFNRDNVRGHRCEQLMSNTTRSVRWRKLTKCGRETLVTIARRPCGLGLEA